MVVLLHFNQTRIWSKYFSKNPKTFPENPPTWSRAVPRGHSDGYTIRNLCYPLQMFCEWSEKIPETFYTLYIPSFCFSSLSFLSRGTSNQFRVMKSPYGASRSYSLDTSARRTDLSLTTHNAHNRHTSMPRRDSNPQAAADPQLTPRGHWDRQTFYIKCITGTPSTFNEFLTCEVWGLWAG
jgi:hypothetical protein